MSIDKLELFLGDAYQSRPHLKFSNIKLRKKILFIDDREIICDIFIWTEIDLESYVRNYYVNRQVRAVFRWRISIQTIFEIFKYLIKKKKKCLWMTGRLDVIPTCEQKLIWTNM